MSGSEFNIFHKHFELMRLVQILNLVRTHLYVQTFCMATRGYSVVATDLRVAALEEYYILAGNQSVLVGRIRWD